MDANALIARIRRAMPRNADVMALCDWTERLLVNRAPPEKAQKELLEQVRGGFDKKAYQRELMRKRRAEGKAK